MCSTDHTPIERSCATYRLLVEVPFTVSFPSITYRVEWAVLPHERRLMLCEPGRGGGYLIVAFPSGDSGSLYGGRVVEHAADQIRAFNFAPIEVPRPSVLDTVFRRLVREMRAERLL